MDEANKCDKKNLEIFRCMNLWTYLCERDVEIRKARVRGRVRESDRTSGIDTHSHACTFKSLHRLTIALYYFGGIWPASHEVRDGRRSTATGGSIGGCLHCCGNRSTASLPWCSSSLSFSLRGGPSIGVNPRLSRSPHRVKCLLHLVMHHWARAVMSE